MEHQLNNNQNKRWHMPVVPYSFIYSIYYFFYKTKLLKRLYSLDALLIPLLKFLVALQDAKDDVSLFLRQVVQVHLR